MKGSPWIEVILVGAVSALLAMPLAWLIAEREPARAEVEAMDVSGNRIEAWMDFRFSHPPLEARLRQNGEDLWRGGGNPRDDVYVDLVLDEGRADLRLEVVWPETVDQAYAEVVVEAGALPAERRGGWGGPGENTLTWRFEWTEAP